MTTLVSWDGGGIGGFSVLKAHRLSVINYVKGGKGKTKCSLFKMHVLPSEQFLVLTRKK